MTLIDAIIKANTKKTTKKGRKCTSPPPDSVSSDMGIKPLKKKRNYKYAYVKARVDSSPPHYNAVAKLRSLQNWHHRIQRLRMENIYLLMLIKKTYFMGGRVDSHWVYEPLRPMQYYQHRVDFLKKIRTDNLVLYQRIMAANSRVETTAELDRAWARNRRKIVDQALCTFVLFPPIPCEEIEDSAFVAPPDVKRPRVYIKLGMKEGAVIGEICVELFTDTCPRTCQLFLELLDGDTLGHGYIKTCFYRKVPKLYWSGGDVIYDNGFGCYAQRGRAIPIGAENYHFPHSMAGLLSMRVTMDDEMCGIFNITFKPLPQLDLRNVVFGRVIRPSTTYNIISQLGNALSSRPIIEVISSRRKQEGRWIVGQPNTRLASRSAGFLRKMLMS
ncbi:uncharacterized protein LOC118278437 isoform X1 [Spodoptera frugiperda]|uniref:Uncharacterized protein LOC118278437 isoform X1 n=2 Tax=Spodoptera frugiperda TaxID=7108 RepID=A0A9R0F2P3_SPOFR|nr:uncharacterized protein LOC118278437 isoform X1 [Spodoptera frugiperda]